MPDRLKYSQTHESLRILYLKQPNNWIQKGTAENPLVFRNSNWTIPLMEFTYVTLSLNSNHHMCT